MENNTHGGKEDASRARPHVRLFGQDMRSSSEDRDGQSNNTNDEKKYEKVVWVGRRHRGGMLFGLIVLFIGIVLFFNALGILPAGFWHTIAPLWPALLIIWGLSIILGDHWLARIVVLLLALALFLIVISYGLSRNAPPIRTSFVAGSAYLI